jgi:hypothetical protein
MLSSLGSAVSADLNELAPKVCSGLVQQSVSFLAIALLVAEGGEVILGLR